MNPHRLMFGTLVLQVVAIFCRGGVGLWILGGGYWLAAVVHSGQDFKKIIPALTSCIILCLQVHRDKGNASLGLQWLGAVL